MDIKKIKELIALLEGSGVAEIEIHEGDGSVRISRYSNVAQASPTIIANAAPATVVAAPVNIAPVEIVTVEPTGHKITAPMVGTFFRASSPNDSAFVEIGTQVKVGDPLCIIEAMKMLNQIEADKAGVIRAISAENGQPVEFGQLLFTID